MSAILKTQDGRRDVRGKLEGVFPSQDGIKKQKDSAAHHL